PLLATVPPPPDPPLFPYTTLFRSRSAMSCAVAPTRSSNDRPVARVPERRTYCFGMVTVCPGLTPRAMALARDPAPTSTRSGGGRSEEHTSELQSLRHLVCRLLLEK